jgi:hypothetical protein
MNCLPWMFTLRLKRLGVSHLACLPTVHWTTSFLA